MSNYLETFTIGYYEYKQYNSSFRRGNRHTYDDGAPYITSKINYRDDLEHFEYKWFKNGKPERMGNAANIGITRRTDNMKIVAIGVCDRPGGKLSKSLEFYDDYRMRMSLGRSINDPFYIHSIKESKKAPRNNTQIIEWLWRKHKLQF